MDASELITEWRAEYPAVGSIEWTGYEDLGDSTLGVTRYPAGSAPRISLHIALEGHPIWSRAVLWHEFAHVAADYGGHAEAHGSEWRGWLWRKPLLALIDMFAPEPRLL